LRRRAGFVFDVGVAETCEAEAVEEEVVAVARVVSLLTFEALAVAKRLAERCASVPGVAVPLRAANLLTEKPVVLILAAMPLAEVEGSTEAEDAEEASVTLLRATGVANAGEANGLELPFVEGAEAVAAAAVAAEELELELELETELLSANGLEGLAVAAANRFADAIGTRGAAPKAGDSRRGAAAVPFRAASLLIIFVRHSGAYGHLLHSPPVSIRCKRRREGFMGEGVALKPIKI
jgi:hypothetical protein